MIKRLFTAAFHCPYFVLTALGGLSAFALIAALVGQYGFDLHPCILCLYQRIPFAIVILMSVLGLVSLSYMPKHFAIFNIAVSAIALLGNSGLAFYHVGVEQHWWVSGCSVPNFDGLSPEDIMNALTVSTTPGCDEIPWELFGISMAGYNVMFCAGLGAYATIAAITLYKKYKSA